MGDRVVEAGVEAGEWLGQVAEERRLTMLLPRAQLSSGLITLRSFKEECQE
jgi:hypothetical protein